ncbi:YdhR family protein [Actinomycetaceae bacterium MB13-C1-2]|nr:YdhR family protein [Actinomycetaceae bacterium MB13-C1-2]
MPVILQVTMKVDVAYARAIFTPAEAAKRAGIPGMQWKIWAADPFENEATGIYLFTDRQAAEARATEAVPLLRQTAGIRSVHAQIFEVWEDNSRMTNAPID